MCFETPREKSINFSKEVLSLNSFMSTTPSCRLNIFSVTTFSEINVLTSSLVNTFP